MFLNPSPLVKSSGIILNQSLSFRSIDTGSAFMCPVSANVTEESVPEDEA